MDLASLNALPPHEAETAFLDCCGSTVWARRMTESRPFLTLVDLIGSADKTWASLGPSDWLEAFAAHPKIGSDNPAPVQNARAADWSSGEQSGMDAADTRIREDLAEANRLYEDRFGFIFIVCASGKSAGEMLAICRERMQNDRDTELRIAAGEQQKITEIRLSKLINE